MSEFTRNNMPAVGTRVRITNYGGQPVPPTLFGVVDLVDDWYARVHLDERWSETNRLLCRPTELESATTSTHSHWSPE